MSCKNYSPAVLGAPKTAEKLSMLNFCIIKRKRGICNFISFVFIFVVFAILIIWAIVGGILSHNDNYPNYIWNKNANRTIGTIISTGDHSRFDNSDYPFSLEIFVTYNINNTMYNSSGEILLKTKEELDHQKNYYKINMNISIY